jgi:hypothetical protein
MTWFDQSENSTGPVKLTIIESSFYQFYSWKWLGLTDQRIEQVRGCPSHKKNCTKYPVLSEALKNQNHNKV